MVQEARISSETEKPNLFLGRVSASLNVDRNYFDEFEKRIDKKKDRGLSRKEMRRVFRDWKSGELYPLSVCKKFA